MGVIYRSQTETMAVADGQGSKMQKVTCLYFPNVIEDGTESATIPIPAIILVRGMKDDAGYKIRLDLKSGKFLIVGYDSEEEMQKDLSRMQEAINEFYNALG